MTSSDVADEVGTHVAGGPPIQTAHVPEDVARFMQSLYKEVYARDVKTIKRVYEEDYNSITQKLFQSSRWPSIEDVKETQQDFHPLIATLYEELYYRHVWSNCSGSITWSDRRASYMNYAPLIGYFIDQECKPKEGQPGLQLPEQWLWDILDEFVYQYQDTQRKRFKFAESAEHQKELQENGGNRDDPKWTPIEKVWPSRVILWSLRTIVEKTEIRPFLAAVAAKLTGVPETLSFDQSLGYFTMICLLRVHVLFGDYRAALKAVEGIDIGPRGLYHRVPACHVTLFYYMSFAFVMLRRYQDAIKHLTSILSFISRDRSYIYSQSYQSNAMSKTVDKMYFLLLLCTFLSPGRPDEQTASLLRDKTQENSHKKINLANDFNAKLQDGDELVYQDVFNKCAPKFIDPSIPTANDINRLKEIQATADEPLQRQLQAFCRDVRFQRKVSNVRSFAKLYNNIQLLKLASLMDIKEKNAAEVVRSELLCVKHKGRETVQTNSSVFLEGANVQTLSDIDFYVDNDVVHVKSVRQKETNMDRLFKQLMKAQEMLPEAVSDLPRR